MTFGFVISDFSFPFFLCVVYTDVIRHCFVSQNGAAEKATWSWTSFYDIFLFGDVCVIFNRSPDMLFRYWIVLWRYIIGWIYLLSGKDYKGDGYGLWKGTLQEWLRKSTKHVRIVDNVAEIQTWCFMNENTGRYRDTPMYPIESTISGALETVL